MSLNRAAILKKLQNDQARIEYSGEDDEGAQEFYGEIQFVIEVLQRPESTDADIRDAALHVSHSIEVQ